MRLMIAGRHLYDGEGLKADDTEERGCQVALEV